MTKDVLLEKLKIACATCHLFERTIAENPIFKADKFPFKSPTLQLAFNEARSARMFAGDCLRLYVLGAEHRSDARFVPAEHGGTWKQQILLLGEDYFQKDASEVIKERVTLQELKLVLREFYYQFGDVITSMTSEQLANIHYSRWEMHLYLNSLLTSLKKCDQLLGLRLGELA